MRLICEQKTAIIDEKHIAYVEVKLVDEESKHDYRVLFDKQTKKRFNAFMTSKGFKIGVLSDDEIVTDKIIEI